MSQQTPLHATHIAHKATMVSFAGFDMPVKYGSEKEEHFAVRNHVGLFDVSHMGEIVVKGTDATRFLSMIFPADISLMKPGQAKYTMLLNKDGGIIDDLLVYCRTDMDYMICANASNQERVYDTLVNISRNVEPLPHVRLLNESEHVAQVALQGPYAAQLVQERFDASLTELSYYHFTNFQWKDVTVTASRTGYTGEDGFEFYMPNMLAVDFWQHLTKDDGARPCGLAARDTLRLEAGMCLHGNDIDAQTTPLEAGLNWTIDWSDTRDFVGKKALLAQKEQGLEQRLRGFEVLGRGILRRDTPIYNGEQLVGRVTSGTMSPTLKKAIGLAYIQVGHHRFGTALEAELRGRRVPLKLCKIPFYKR